MTTATVVHVMIRVLNFERSKKFYALLGMNEIDRYEFTDFRICYLGADTGPQIELIENIGRTDPYALGEGFGNVAFTVADAAACHGSFAAAGFAPRAVKDMDYGGRLIARYFHVFDPDGYRVEVIERAGRWAKQRPDRSWLL